jgi:uncharacterized protein YkwD
MKFQYLGVLVFALLLNSFIYPIDKESASAVTLQTSAIQEVVKEINKERISRGISPLQLNSTLSSIAQSRSVYLAGAGRIFHLSAPAGTPWPELWNAGYPYSAAGENLALGVETPPELVARWMASPTHRDNLLSRLYVDVGLGVTTGSYVSAGRPVSYVVAYFGSPQKIQEAVGTKRHDSVVPFASPSTSTSASVQSTILANLQTPVVLAATSAPVESKEEQIRLMKEIIYLLESYLKLLKMNSGLR